MTTQQRINRLHDLRDIAVRKGQPTTTIDRRIADVHREDHRLRRIDEAVRRLSSSDAFIRAEAKADLEALHN